MKEIKKLPENKAWKEYVLYGVLPPVVLQEKEKQKKRIFIKSINISKRYY